MSQASPGNLSSKNPPKIKWSDITVLVAEDDDDLREIMCTYFESQGCKVFSATNGVEAFELLQSEKGIQIVVSDVRMPVGDGIELLKNIRAKSKDLPVVFLATGHADLSETDAKRFGAAALILKPFSIVDLFGKIEAELYRSKTFTESLT